MSCFSVVYLYTYSSKCWFCTSPHTKMLHSDVELHQSIKELNCALSQINIIYNSGIEIKLCEVNIRNFIYLNWITIIAAIHTSKAIEKIKPERKIRLERDSNPWPLQYRCSGLTNWAILKANWELVTWWVRDVPVDGEDVKWIWNFIHLNCRITI